MPFQNDEQRRAAFWRMKSKSTGGGGSSGGGRGQQPSNTGGGAPPIFDTLADLFNNTFTPMPNGPGINYTQGTFVGTGGAIYNTPGSNWFVAPEQSPIYGNLPGYGTPQYQQQWTPAFEPAQTFLGSMYLILSGVDPNTGQVLPPEGTPGTLSLSAMPLLRDIPLEKIGRNARGDYDPLKYGSPGNQKIPSGLRVQSPKRNNPRPWWAK